jgi:hypothetical protein
MKTQVLREGRLGDLQSYAVLIPAAPHELLQRAVPDNGTDFTLAELHEAVGGYIETVPVAGFPPSLLLLIVNEDGHRLGLLRNEYASKLAGQLIVGTAVLTPRKFLR